MTVKEYLRGIEDTKLESAAKQEKMSFCDAMQDVVEIWSNDACKGYFINSAQIFGLDLKTIREMLKAYNEAFDNLSVDDAAELYRTF